MLAQDVWPPVNSYTYRGSLQWCDFARILCNSRAPHARLVFSYYSRLIPDIVTILDYHQPKLMIRQGLWKPAVEAQGNAAAEWQAFSIITNGAWLRGEIPLNDLPGMLAKDVEGKDTARVARRPYYGARHVVKALLGSGSIRPTFEVGMLLGDRRMSLYGE